MYSWITVLVQSSRELYPPHTDGKGQGDFPPQTSAATPQQPCQRHVQFTAFCASTLTLPCANGTLSFHRLKGCCLLSECATDRVSLPMSKCLQQGAAPQAEAGPAHSQPCCQQVNGGHPSGESMGNNCCQRPRSHSAHNNIV